MTYHNLSIENTLKQLNTDKELGLSTKEAKKRLKIYDFNELASPKKKSLLMRFFSQFTDFMILILIFAAFISFFVSYLNGEADYIDPIIIFSIIIMNAIIGVIQETKAEHSLEALKKLSAPNASVIRDGIHTTIPAKELVPGDIILLETGYFVPADARLISSINLKIDESSLTGESVPVKKNAEVVLSENTPLAEQINVVPSSGIVTYGRGMAVITATGMNTQVGHIAKLIMEEGILQTPLQKRLAKTGQILGIVALLICAIIFILGIIQGRPIFDMFMTSVSLAVAAIPEGLPAVVTIMLSLGVQRMAKRNTVIRKLPAVETLGSATVICSDKTGTLTQNKMTVTTLYSSKGEESLSSSFGTKILSLATRCTNTYEEQSSKQSNTILPSKSNETTITGEPTEVAITTAAKQQGISKSKLDLTYKRVEEIPFDSSRKLMTTIHKNNASYEVITKGAFDMLLPKCSYILIGEKEVPMTEEYRKRLNAYNLSMTNDALRVLSVATKKISSLSGQYEQGLTFIGLLGMIDPPRKEVKEAVTTCKLAGIRPVMITGDHIATASAIGRNLGILSSNEKAITGQELNNMSEEDLLNHIHEYSVFARVSPEHKVRIVKAFQKKGNVVAMTGDGVNDAPALKAADIGCAMGMTGTDVAKNAADMILTDDNFSTIIAAVKEGRGIYDNIRKSIHFLLSSNIGEILTIFASILMDLPTPLLAVQLLWINLVTDSLPAISLGTEKPEKDIMKRKPISPEKGIFADGLVFQIIIEGFLIGILSLTAFVYGYKISPNKSLLLGRTMCFCVLALSQLFHSFNMRSSLSLFKIKLFDNIRLTFSFFICTLLQIFIVMHPVLSTIFKVQCLTIKQWYIVFFLSFMPIIIVELQKELNQNRNFKN